MIKSGAKPNTIDHRDYKFVPEFGSVAQPWFPTEYETDANLWMPDQNKPEPTFNIPAEPYGCTNYTQADLSADIVGKLQNPAWLERITHANERGGISVRESLLAAKSLGIINAFFNIQAHGSLDNFDTIRLAIMSGAPEKRSVSWGTPWFPSWEAAAQNRIAIMPMPSEAELGIIHKDPQLFSWHNSKLAGFTTRNGIPYLKCKSWQGTNVGEEGWLYIPREVVNTVMAIPGTVAFTASNMKPNTVQTISVTYLQWLMSYIRTFVGFSY